MLYLTTLVMLLEEEFCSVVLKHVEYWACIGTFKTVLKFNFNNMSVAELYKANISSSSIILKC